MMEQKQKITKADAVAYCIIAYNSIIVFKLKKYIFYFFRTYKAKKAEKILNDSNNK